MIAKELVHIKELNFAKAYNCFTNFNGTNEYVSVPTSTTTNLQSTDPITIAAWVYLSPTFTFFEIITKWTVSAGWGLGVAGNLSLRFNLSSGGGPQTDTYSSTPLPVGEWVHVAVTKTSGACFRTSMNFYINGVQNAPLALGNNNLGTQNILNADPVEIGRLALLGRYAEGGLEDLALFDRELTALEIADIYSRGRIGPQYGDIANLTSHYPMSNLSYTDNVGGFNGTPSNMDISNIICSGVERQAYVELNGTNEYMRAGNAAPYDFEWSDQWSVSVWVKSSSSARIPIVGKFGAEGWFLEVLTNKEVHFFMRDVNYVNGEALDIYSAHNLVPSGVLKHVVVVNTGTGVASGVKLYVDNVEYPWVAISRTPIQAPYSIKTTEDLIIGASIPGGLYADMELHDFRLWDKALDATEVSAEYGLGDKPNGYPTAYSNLVSWNKCGEEVSFSGSTPIFDDSSGAGIDFTGINMDIDNIKYT